jgi:hypothetical protein
MKIEINVPSWEPAFEPAFRPWDFKPVHLFELLIVEIVAIRGIVRNSLGLSPI